jgi:hypothetical protein
MKRWSTALLLLAAVAVPTRAADKPRPNTLTPKEIADGWILLFDGETTFGWDAVAEPKVADGVLTLTGGAKASYLTSTTAFGSFELRFEWRIDGDGKPPSGLLTWKRVPEDRKISLGHYACQLRRDPAQKADGWGTGVVTVLADRTDYQVQASPNDFFRTEAVNLPAGSKSNPALLTFVAFAGQKLTLRNVKLRPLDAKPLFNGKDLSGWKKYTADEKRAKTEFSVTEEGFLHLKNGPGDLQTEKQYDDFVLQVECRTNGERLNSGVFFRCIPGEYQNGYEAQIHNGFDADKPREYTVEEYDPKTNELKDKKKVKSAALDYGTGAIYRRVPARKQAAKDNEWFTMTVVAQGRHIATWVNGEQTVDWTDNRPLKDNPRNGCRLEKGGISLQGHDPTTSIDFRSIRLAELPRPAK